MSKDMPKAEAAIPFESLQISSDGTREGTTITLNGNEINVASASFHFWDDDYPPQVAFRFTQRDEEVEPGQMAEYKSFDLVPPVPGGAEASMAAKPVRADDLRGTNRQSHYARM